MDEGSPHEALRPVLSLRLFVILNLALGAGHFLVLFNTGAYIPMIPYAAASLGRAVSFGDWTQANFYIAMALAFPLAPWFRARFGERQTLVWAFVFFALASVLCAATGHFWVFLLGRGIQGFSGGLTIPVSLVAILRHYRPQQRNLGLILWGMASLTPFTLGPTVGGLLISVAGWRALFVANVMIALLVAAVTAIVLPACKVRDYHPPLDRGGIVLLAGALLSGLWAADLAETRDWWRSSSVEGLAILSIAMLVLFVVWEWGKKHPLIDLRLFKRRNFAIGAAGLFVSALVFQGLLAVYIIQFEVVLGYTALWTGLLILPMALFSKMTSIWVHHWMRRIDPRLLAFVALAGMAVGTFFVSSYNRDASFQELIWPQVVAGLFLGGLFPPFAAIGLSGLSGRAEIKASAVLNLFRVSGQAFGIPCLAILIDRRRILHRHFLGEVDEGARQHIQALLGTLRAHGVSAQAAYALIVHAADRAADLLAFNELFFVATWAFLGMGALLLFARPVIFEEGDRQKGLAVQELVEL